MPRNANGDFSLVSGNPVLTGTVIESNWANNTMSDLSLAMTDSLSRSGQGGMIVPMTGIAGGEGLPAYSFSDFPQTGMYAFDGNDLRITVGGVDRWRWLAANALPQTWDNINQIWEDAGGGGIIWEQADVPPATALISHGYVTLGGQSINMPVNPPSGFSVAFADKADNWSATNTLTLNGNGNTFTQDGSSQYVLDLMGAFAQFSYLEGQWQIVNFGRLSDAYGYDIDNYLPLAGGTMSGELTTTAGLVSSNGVNFTLPASSAGLQIGDLWNDAGVVSIVI